MKLSDFALTNVSELGLRQLDFDSDPLRKKDGLYEAYPVSVTLDTIRGRGYVVFDCRYSEEIEGDTALLVAVRPSIFEWARDQTQHLGQRTVAIWEVASAQEWEGKASLGWTGTETLTVRAPEVYFLSGDVPGMDGAAPDFVEDSEDRISAGLPSLESTFAPRGFSHFRGSSIPASVM